MKLRRLFVVGLAFLMAGLSALTWYYGFLPILDGPARAGVRHALNLGALPFGVTINASGAESWTDYIFEADLSISPDQFDNLLAGRDFAKDPTGSTSAFAAAYRIDGYEGFPVSESWSWSHRPEDLREGDYGTTCIVYTNNTHDRIFIRYTAD